MRESEKVDSVSSPPGSESTSGLRLKFSHSGSRVFLEDQTRLRSRSHALKAAVTAGDAAGRVLADMMLRKKIQARIGFQ